jgi:hypothetical protein
MSRHWNPDGELAPGAARRARARWPEGATAGLVLVGAACLGIALLLYKLTGPSDVFGR